MTNEDSTTPTTEDTEGHAILKDKVDRAGTEDDTNAHIQWKRISDAGTDDDVEGNKLK